MEKTMEKIVALAKARGFVYPGSEIYGGLANSWDYGPLGVSLKNNIKSAWWKKFVVENKNIVGLDSAIILNPKIWEASGHVATFNDPLIDCKYCHSRFRADKLVEEHDADVKASVMTNEELEQYIGEHIDCPNCGHRNFTNIRQFQLMFKTSIGVVEDSKSLAYLRPETAQGIFVNFKNVMRSSRKKIPFGIGQIGKAFRNEITPGNFIFRTREFEQMELEFFCKPGTDLQWYEYFKKYCYDFLLNIGIKEENLQYLEYEPNELAHYSKATCDILFNFPFSNHFEELWGIAHRSDYDLGKHQEYSGENMEYLDPETREKYIPYVIEPSVGVDRLLLAVLCDAYDEEVVKDDDVRTVLHLHPALAPFKAAIFPLTKQQTELANNLFDDLVKDFEVDFDASGSIGKRYRRQDAIGTPYCITVDFDSETDQSVTIRDRDTMEQQRIKIADLKEFLANAIKL